MELFSTCMMGAETAIWVWLTLVYLIKRRQRSKLFRAGMFAALIVYFVVYETATYYWGDRIWFLTGVIELLVLFTVLILNNEGCIWRNFCMLVLTEAIASIVVSIGLMPFPYWEQQLVKLVSFQSLSVRDTIILVFGYMSVAFVAAFLIMRRFFPREYEGDSRIYRVVAIGYIVISYISLGARRHFVDQIKQGNISDQIWVGMLATWMAGCAVLIYYVPYARNRVERAYGKREQQMLAHMLAESSAHFETLISYNLTLGQSGRLMIDAILADYKQKAEAKGIRFDAVVQPLAGVRMQELDVACLLDDMLALGFSHMRLRADGAFVQIDVRYMNGCLFLETAYPGEYRTPADTAEKMVELLVKKYEGTRTVRKKNHEVCIGVLLPMNEGETGD